MRIAGVMVLLTALLSSASALAFTIPEETVTDYYNTIFLPITFTDHSTQLDQRWCKAYAMLAEETRAVLSSDDFGRALWVQRMGWGRRDMTVGTATYNDQRMMAKVPLTLRLQSWTGLDPVSQHSVITLVKQPDIWKIVLSSEQLANYRAAAKHLNRRITCS